MEGSFSPELLSASLCLDPTIPGGAGDVTWCLGTFIMLPDRDLLCQVSLEINVIITNNGNNNDNSKVLEYSRALARDQNNIVLSTAKPFLSPLESGTNKVTKAWE